MMLGVQGSTSSPKVFRCSACSATFTGLASLLVHQATHASPLSKGSSPPRHSNSPRDPLVLSMGSSEQPSPSTLLPEISSPSFYICDCGEEFQDFSLMLEHKQSHISEKLQQPLVINSTPSGTGLNMPLPTEDGLVHNCPSTSRSPPVKQPPLTAGNVDVSLEEGIAIVTPPQGERTPPQDDGENRLENMSAQSGVIQDTVEDMHSLDKIDSPLHRENSENLPQNNSLMKLLASAYMQTSPAPLPQNQNGTTVTPKQEVVPVDISSGAKTAVRPINDLSIAQLRRLLATPGIKTKAPSISKVLELSKKRVVSLTKTFSPVVVLETRQKLKDPGSNDLYGKYQCGRCRRVFQNLDRLTEHHFLHKKERIKCCRRCKQLIIGRLPLPDNHVCPQLANKNTQLSSFNNKLPFAPKIVPFYNQNNARKVFFCPLCKHSYARRWNLKMHKCQGSVAAASRQTFFPLQKMIALRSNSKATTEMDTRDGFKSVAVGTEVTGRIKVEVTSPDLEQSAVSQLAWTTPAKSFPPFYPKTSALEEASLCGMSLEQGGISSSWDAAGENNEESNEGQWTMPLDDETEVLSPAGSAENDAEGNEALAVEQPDTATSSLRYFVRNGVKRYPCTRCQKTYSRPSTLRRHLRLCGFRPRGPMIVAHTGTQNATLVNANNAKPMFPCFVCGRAFNRKDNMMTHRKKCQLRRALSDAAGAALQQSVSNNATDCQMQDDDGSNWGIMSLPSVLPRRVTCECGVGFTSPRLLLEHLQKHAQESYTCPTCGETVSSWADYEVHLQIHMHPHHQLLKGIQPQRSQPLLLRFQQQQQQQQPPQQPQQPQQSQQPQQPQQPQPEQKHTVKVALTPNPSKKQRIVCTRCSNTFATRCSLRRHLSWNRCKGARAANPQSNPPKTYHCSHCNSDFPNSISLLFHQRSGACKPAIKPVRCPVCLRWFGTVETLQKHLLTHKHSETYRCDVCQGSYHSLKSLKNHRRRIHRIMAGAMVPKTQE